MSAARIWWSDDGHGGLCGYIGAGIEGLEFVRHGYYCRPGFWNVTVTGWLASVGCAVVDDFGNIVQVHPR